MTHLYLIISTAAIPAGTRCRILGDWPMGGLLVQTEYAVDGLESAPAEWPNGEPTDPDYNPQWPCCVEWQTIEAPISEPLPNIETTVAAAVTLANNDTVRFSEALKAAVPVEMIVGLVNASDGAKIQVVE